MLNLFKQDIKCFALSHRWRFLYTQIPQLTIFPPSALFNNKSFRLLKHSSNFEAFHLYNDCKFSYQNLWKCFHVLACPTLSLCIKSFCLTSMSKIAFSFILNLYFALTYFITMVVVISDFDFRYLGFWNIFAFNISFFSTFANIFLCKFIFVHFPNNATAHILNC